jgi:hypothetical protein
MKSIKVPDEVMKILQKVMYSVDDDDDFIFPIFNDGIFLLLASKLLQKEFDEIKRHPSTLKQFQKDMLKQIQKLQRDGIIPLDAKKIRKDILE